MRKHAGLYGGKITNAGRFSVVMGKSGQVYLPRMDSIVEIDVGRENWIICVTVTVLFRLWQLLAETKDNIAESSIVIRSISAIRRGAL